MLSHRKCAATQGDPKCALSGYSQQCPQHSSFSDPAWQMPAAVLTPCQCLGSSKRRVSAIQQPAHVSPNFESLVLNRQDLRLKRLGRGFFPKSNGYGYVPRCACHFVAPVLPRLTISLVDEISRGSYGAKRNSRKPRHSGRGFLFGTLPNRAWLD